MRQRPHPALYPRLIRIAGTIAASLAVLATANANAQTNDFPNKPIRLITPYPAGASTDMLARTVAQSMAKRLGQPVVVDNRPGAGGIIAADTTAKSAPDGYTFLLVSAGIVTMNQSIYKKLPYDPIKDLAPLSIAVQLPLVIVVNNSVPIRTTKELLDMAKAQPGKLTYGSAGTGTSQHLAGELFKSMAKADIMHVPYKGGGPAMTDLLGGQISMMFVQTPSALHQARGGKIRAIAIGSSKRSPMMPDVPTIAESGVPGYNSDTWYGFVAPAGVPPAIMSKLHASIVEALQENKEKLTNEGFVVTGSTQQDMAAVIKSDAAKWGAIIRSAGITAE
jgi:tripartite-type tricarboxylate transporter receptor subunit TctC